MIETWRREQFYSRADHFFSDYLLAIESAQSSILLESYIFAWDEVGRRVMASLRRAVARGVSVKVMVDAIGSMESLGRLSDACDQHGVNLKIYHPLPWQWHLFRKGGRVGSALANTAYFLRVINNRDHRKLLVIDDDRIFTGSFNLSQVHCPIEQGGQNWIDMGVQLEGGLCHELAQQFRDMWNTHKATPSDRGMAKISHSFSSYLQNYHPLQRLKKRLLIRRKLRQAQHRIWLCNAYFAPRKGLLRLLCRAAEQGVDVRVLVSSRSDVPFFPMLTASYYRVLLQAGVKVYQHSERMVHAKTILFDDEALIGTTNLNNRSSLHDLEIDVFVYRSETLTNVQACFTESFAEAEIIDWQTLKRPPKLWVWLLRKFSYWM